VRDARFPVLVDGVFQPAEAGAISTGAFGVFDTLLAEDGVRWFEDRHLARLRAACEHFAIPVYQRVDVAAEIARYGAEIGPQPALIRTCASLDPRSGAPTLVVRARSPRTVPDAGVDLDLVAAQPDPSGSWKTTNRLAGDLHVARAERAGCFDALLGLPGGAVVEAARANLFAVVDGVVCTPPRSAGVLPGIVRGLLLEHLPGASEADLDVTTLRRASEVWITSSGLRVAPVRAIRGLRDDLPGPGGPAVHAARAELRRCEADYRDRTAVG